MKEVYDFSNAEHGKFIRSDLRMTLHGLMQVPFGPGSN